MTACLGIHAGGVSLPQLAPRPKPPSPIPSHSTGVKLKILQQRDCSSHRGTVLLRQHNDNHQSGTGQQSYKTGVFMGGPTTSQTQKRVKTRLSLVTRINSVVLCCSDESSGSLGGASLCQSRPSVCSTETSLPPCFSPSHIYFLPPSIPLFISLIPALFCPMAACLVGSKWHWAITAHPLGNVGKCLVDSKRRDWLRLSQLMDGFSDTCLGQEGSRWRRTCGTVSERISF